MTPPHPSRDELRGCRHPDGWGRGTPPPPPPTGGDRDIAPGGEGAQGHPTGGQGHCTERRGTPHRGQGGTGSPHRGEGPAASPSPPEVPGAGRSRAAGASRGCEACGVPSSPGGVPASFSRPWG